MIRGNKGRYIELIAVSAVMAALIAWFFKNALFAGRIFVERDLSRYYYPLRQFAVTCMKSGVFPLWNPYLFCGSPLFAGLQEGVLYPFSIIYYLGDFAKMFNAFIVFHFFAAGMFTYLLMRRMGVSVCGGFLSAAAFALSGYMVSVINLLTTLAAVTWFPLAVLFAYEILKPQAPAEKRYLNAVFLGLTWTFMFLGGEPSILYITVALSAAGSAYFTAERLLEKKKHVFSHILPFALALAVFLGLSSFQLVPFMELVKISGRKHMGMAVSSAWNMPARDIISMAVPFFHDIFRLFEDYWKRQSWLDNYYAGILVVLLAAAGAVWHGSKKAKAVFALGLAGLAAAFGKALSVYPLLYKFLPGCRYIRYTIRFYFIPVFCVCVLAGLGLDYCMKNAKKEAFRKRAFFILSLSVCASIAYLFLNTHFNEISAAVKSFAAGRALDVCLPPGHFYEAVKGPVFEKFIAVSLVNLRRACLFVMIAGVFIYFASLKTVRIQRVIFPWIVFLAVADLAMVNGGYSPQEKIEKFTRPSANIEELTQARDSRLEEYPGDLNKSLFRICASPQAGAEHNYVPEPDFFEGLEASKDRLISNRMMEFGIYDASMYGSLYLRRNSAVMRLIMGPESENLHGLLDMLNVRFIASPKGPEAVRDWTLANRTGPANLYENEDYLPRAFLVSNFKVIGDEDEIFEFMGSKAFEPAKTAVLEEEPVDVRRGTWDVGRGTLENLCPSSNMSNVTRKHMSEAVRITTYKPNEVIVQADAAETPKFLVLTDTFYPGWKAYVNGKRAHIYRANGAFRAVYLRPGSHVVRFVFRPAAFILGIFISALTLPAIIIIFKLTYRK